MKCVICIGLAVVLLQAAPERQDVVTIQNTQSTLERGVPAIETFIANKTGVALSAWKLSVEFTGPDGSRSSRAVTRDIFGEVAGVEAKRINIPAAGPTAGMIREVILVDAKPTDAVNANLEAAVFADGTWIGSERVVNEIFERRLREQRAWIAIADAMREGLTHAGKESLNSALSALNRLDQADSEHPAKKVMRRNLERAVAGQLAAKGQPHDFLRAWVQEADVRATAANAHSKRGVERVRK